MAILLAYLKVPLSWREIAMRAWVAKRRRQGEKPPSADEVEKGAGQRRAS